MHLGQRYLLAGAILLAAGAGYAWAITLLPDRSLPGTPGPEFFPILIAVGLIGLAAALAIRGLLELRALRALRGQSRTHADYSLPPRGWFALGGFAAYLVLLPFAGFAVASVPFFGGLMVLFGERRTPAIVLAAVTIPLTLYLVFTTGFRILLPAGSLW